MNEWVECRQCPSCGSTDLSDPLPPGARVDSTLDLVMGAGSPDDFGGVDLSPFVSPEFAICERCALLFMRRRSTPEAAARYYPRLFHRIETPIPFGDLPLPERFVERRGRLARDLVTELERAGVLAGVRSVLHVRFNTAEELRLLRDEYGIEEVYGLEFLPSLIRHARETAGLERVEAIEAPEFRNPFERPRFDLVLLNEAFGHAHDPGAIAATAKTLVSEGGSVIVYNEKNHAKVLRDGKLFPHGMNFFHKQMYTRANLRSFLELAGYRVESLSHPTIGKPSSLKNSKLLYALRPEAVEVSGLPSTEVDEMKRLFRQWWSRHRWVRRRERLASLFRRARPGVGVGGAART